MNHAYVCPFTGIVYNINAASTTWTDPTTGVVYRQTAPSEEKPTPQRPAKHKLE